jgi:hypothetical protein
METILPVGQSTHAAVQIVLMPVIDDDTTRSRSDDIV